MADFLLEIGTEEIPARMIDAASAELRQRVVDLLTRERLVEIARAAAGEVSSSTTQGVYQESGKGSGVEKNGPAIAVESYSTPRRLAVLVRQVTTKQPDVEERVTGPSAKVAYKDGQPTAAASAFAKKVGVPVEQLEKVSTPKGEYLAATVTRRGREAAEILAEALPKEIAGIYWPKSMYWRSPGERFIRPVRWLVATLDGDVVPLEFAGIRAGRISRGHRTLGKDVAVTEPASYAAAMKQGSVYVSREERYQLIRKLLDQKVREIENPPSRSNDGSEKGGAPTPAEEGRATRARWREDRELLDTVVNLTEFPAVILGNFDREFLSLPEEVLVTVMRDHQKYFAVEGSTPADATATSAGGPAHTTGRGKLLAYFLAVLNTDGDRAGIIRHGHERVLRARFSDARFFWETDQKISLRQRVDKLKTVTFQKDLGSYYEKTLRVQRLASQISATVKQAGMAVRPGVIHKAALLAKTDLTTELVKEFTELQGIVGGLYARVQQLDPEMTESAREAIAIAIYDQYKPESMEDAPPRTVEGAILSIADKADSIAGMFALGLVPSGSKDPFALRRQANGIVKTVAEHGLPLSLRWMMTESRRGYEGSHAEKKFSAQTDYAGAVREFFRERLEFYLREARGFAYDVVNAVLAAGADDVVEATARAEAVAQVRESEDFAHIAVAFKRIKNILRQAQETGKRTGAGVDPGMLREAEEEELVRVSTTVAAQVRPLAREKKYVDALEKMATIRPAVDSFFDHVMVMVEDEELRANRLALLQELLNEFTTIADFAEIVTSS